MCAVEVGTSTQVDVSYTEHYQLKRPTVSSSTSSGGVQLNGHDVAGGLLAYSCAVNYVLTVPAVGGRWTLHSGDGSIHVIGGSGADSLDTGNGDITFENVGGDIVARTGNGAIVGDEVRSKSVHASTGNGHVRIAWSAAPSTVAATTGDGGIELLVPPGGGPYRTSTHTGDGGVHVTVPTDPTATATMTAETGNGGITIGLTPAS